MSGSELASRLSYFLWSSMPDATLVELARAGRLSDPDVLAAQARRMLTDERIRRYRHPLPFGATIDRRVMLVTSAERHGLYANITLIRDFEEPDAETQRRMDACQSILAQAHDATRVSATGSSKLRISVMFA